MNLLNLRGNRLILLSLMIMLALVFSACNGDDGEGVQVEEPVVIEGEGEVAEGETEVTTGETEVITETEATTDETEVITETEATEGEATEEADEVTTEVEAEVITDTQVLTETEVITQADVAEVITETTVMTDVTVQEDTVIDSEVMTETADLGTETAPVQIQGADEAQEAGFVIIVLDVEGSQLLADAAEERPIFALSDSSTDLIENENFEPIRVDENVAIGEGLEQSMFGVIDRDGYQQLTFNERPLYRYVGTAEEMETLASEGGFAPLTPEGEPGQ